MIEALKRYWAWQTKPAVLSLTSFAAGWAVERFSLVTLLLKAL